MTQVITRLFADAEGAQSAYDRLRFKGVPAREMDVITAGDEATAEMEAARVHPSAMDGYGKGLASGGAVLVVRATYRPLGAAKLTRDILAKRDTIDVPGVEDDFFAPTPIEKRLSILTEHPHILTVDGIPQPRGNITGQFGMKMLTGRKPKDNLMAHDKRMSRMFWPMPLLSTKQRKSSVYSGGRHMSQAFWPMPLVSKGPRSKSVIPGGALPFSRALGLRTTMD